MAPLFGAINRFWPAFVIAAALICWLVDPILPRPDDWNKFSGLTLSHVVDIVRHFVAYLALPYLLLRAFVKVGSLIGFKESEIFGPFYWSLLLVFICVVVGFQMFERFEWPELIAGLAGTAAYAIAGRVYRHA